jgi:molybdopterin converting factor subunit 1
MRVHVLYFAIARERAGLSGEELELPGPADVSALRAAIAARHPALGAVLDRCRVAVAGEFARDTDPVADGAEVAVIPPVAGGSPEPVLLSAQALSLDAAVAAVAGPDTGGIVTFVGLVREQSHGRRVVRLDYEAYGTMAAQKLREITEDCRERFGARVAVHHRTGLLQVGEAAVVIAAAAPHRGEAFTACRHAIERLKTDVPIWKKEHFEDGTEWVGMGP